MECHENLMVFEFYSSFKLLRERKLTDFKFHEIEATHDLYNTIVKVDIF